MNDARTALVFTSADDLYYYRLGGSDVRRLTWTPETETEISFSPDGALVAFVREGNLVVADIDGQREFPLTTDGGGRVRNGQLDWVYQEEIYGRGDFKRVLVESRFDPGSPIFSSTDIEVPVVHDASTTSRINPEVEDVGLSEGWRSVKP